MSRGMTIADFVQQVLYAIYKVRLDVSDSVDGNFHSKSDKFKEVVMEANMVLQELQKDADWNWLRERWEMGIAHSHHGDVQEFELPDWVYKPCTGYGDAVRLHCPGMPPKQIPWTSPRMGNRIYKKMFDSDGRINPYDIEQQAFQIGNIVTFKRPWLPSERGLLIETDVIRRMDPLHICDDSCPDNCPDAYKNLVFTEIPDPYYMIVKTAAKRAEGDPSAIDRVQSLTDEATKMMSAMRENDSAHTTPDMYETSELGYVEVY